MSSYPQGATALQDPPSSEPTTDAPEWGPFLRPVANEQPTTLEREGNDWPLAVLVFGSALAMYAATGFAVYVALQAFVF